MLGRCKRMLRNRSNDLEHAEGSPGWTSGKVFTMALTGMVIGAFLGSTL